MKMCEIFSSGIGGLKSDIIKLLKVWMLTGGGITENKHRLTDGAGLIWLSKDKASRKSGFFKIAKIFNANNIASSKTRSSVIIAVGTAPMENKPRILTILANPNLIPGIGKGIGRRDST